MASWHRGERDLPGSSAAGHRNGGRSARDPSAPPLHSCPARCTAWPASQGPPRVTRRVMRVITHVTHGTDPARALQEPAFGVTLQDQGGKQPTAPASGRKPHVESPQVCAHLGDAGCHAPAGATSTTEASELGNCGHSQGEVRGSGPPAGAVTSGDFRTRLRRWRLFSSSSASVCPGVAPPGDPAEPHLGSAISIRA